MHFIIKRDMDIEINFLLKIFLRQNLGKRTNTDQADEHHLPDQFSTKEFLIRTSFIHRFLLGIRGKECVPLLS
jgi:hypothetical protein